jgi:hypothetical protein
VILHIFLITATTQNAPALRGEKIMEEIIISVLAGFILIAACYFGRRIEQDSMEPQEIDS